jgi:hypothetical protein
MRQVCIIFFMIVCGIIISLKNASAIILITNDVSMNTTWGPTGTPGFQDSEFLLEGFIFVLEGAELTIQPGVTIYGSKPTNGTENIGALIVDRGAKIHASGTPTQPIVFTSEMVYTGQTPASGDWGGVIVNGYAPIMFGEEFGPVGDLYGGGDPYDDSGEIQYVRIEYAGHWYYDEEGFSGIAFQGVGNGTTVDHVQVYQSGGDCIKIRGGTMQMKYMMGTLCGLDSIDWGLAWRGFAQYLLVRDRADAGINGLNTYDGWDSYPVIYNATLVGDPYTDFGIYSAFGMSMRDFTSGEIHNIIVTGFKSYGLRLDEETSWIAADGDLVIDDGIFWDNNGGNEQFNDFAQSLVQNRWTNLQVIDHHLCRPLDYAMPDFAPAPGSPPVNGIVPVAIPPSGMSGREYLGDTTDGMAWSSPVGNEDGICDPGENCIDYGTFFDVTGFIGAVDPHDDWTYGWTTFGIAKQFVSDLNYSGSVTTLDAQKTLRMASGQEQVAACADANNDGSISVLDAQKALRFASGKDPLRTCCTE